MKFLIMADIFFNISLQRGYLQLREISKTNSTDQLHFLDNGEIHLRSRSKEKYSKKIGRLNWKISEIIIRKMWEGIFGTRNELTEFDLYMNIVFILRVFRENIFSKEIVKKNKKQRCPGSKQINWSSLTKYMSSLNIRTPRIHTQILTYKE